jgi:hypothetical protein
MLLSLLYLAVRRLLRLLTMGGDRDHVARDVELWSCAISCACSHEVVACRFGVGIGSCWRRRPGCYHVIAGDRSRCPRRPYCVGTASS